MGKKQKGGRRQILQLEDKKPPRSSSKNRIKNLIHYSDSDEDSKKSNDSEHSSTVVNKEGCPLDSQVADFFKEIDALTVNEESADATENSVVVVNDSGKEITFNGLECKNLNTDEKLLKKSNATESDGKIESYCPWQEIPDDSTGYSYYWNVETNEVTWDCPDEYAAYISAISSTNADSQIAQNEEIESLKKLQRKKESQLIEGAIIPISYFGDSSSDESEDSQNGCSKLLSKVKKDEKCSTNKGKSSKIGLIKSEQDKINLPSDLIGPQLPPEYRFNEEVPIIEEKLEQSLNLKSDVCDLVESRTIDLSNMSVQNMTFSESEKTSDASFKTCSISSSQSNLNIGVVLPPMSKDCEDFEIRKESISNTENGEIPDSTEKQGDVLTSTGLGLVEYNSFTDDEEEIGSSNLSPINHNTGCNDMLPDPTFQVCHDDKSIENKKMEVTESVIELNDTIIHNKRKNIEEPNEKIQDSLIRKTKKSKSCNAVDIDSMFASHLSNQKHGFGFVKQNTELVESDSSCSDHNQDYSTNRRNDYKSVSFVKSEHVLDLSEINSGMISDELDPLLTNADLKLNNECSKNSLVEKSNEHDFIDTEHFIKEQVYNKKENTVNSTVIKNLSDCESKVLDHEIVSTDTTLHNELALLEEDIDEIDKALCEALVAKKRLENKSGNTLSSPSKIKLASTSKKIGPPMTTPELKDMAVCCVEDSERDDTDEDDIPALGNDKISALDLSSCLVDKLTFLISNDSSLSSLSALLVQLQTRLVDWQAAALENKYFMARLQEVNQYICQYEMGIVSGDWICQWDRENKRYYYVNSRTQHSQWTYPDDQSFDLKTSLTQSQMEVTTSSASSCISEQDENQTVTSSSPANLTLKKKLRSCKTDKGSQSKSSSKKSRKSSPPPPPPGVDSPPPPPPCSPPPHSPPPPPPDSTEVTSDLTEDMDLENSNDSCSPLIISNSSIYEVNRIQASPKLVCSSNSSIKTCGKVRRTNIVTSTLRTENESSNIISTSHQASVSHSDINSNTCVLWSAPRPSCSSEIIKHSEAQNSTTSSRSIVTSQASDNVCDPCLSSSSVTYSSSTDDVPNKASTSSGTALKKEKKKMKLLSVLALKKKNIPSLVEKWQKIKEEQEKEDISGNS